MHALVDRIKCFVLSKGYTIHEIIEPDCVSFSVNDEMLCRWRLDCSGAAMTTFEFIVSRVSEKAFVVKLPHQDSGGGKSFLDGFEGEIMRANRRCVHMYLHVCSITHIFMHIHVYFGIIMYAYVYMYYAITTCAL